MEALYFGKKGIHLNSAERFHIYKETLLDNQLNDKHTLHKITFLKPRLVNKADYHDSPFLTVVSVHPHVVAVGSWQQHGTNVPTYRSVIVTSILLHIIYLFILHYM
jgi:hypothetical protein